ncbi:MAG: hypothetical protein JO276_03870 [Sphingomonadaceae bacterium]|nr:hypothetical protein [Sphingomonadaceae bacterium]
MKLALLLAAAAATGSARAEAAAGGRAADLRCRIALAYVENLLSEPRWRRSVFSTEGVVPFIPDRYPEHWGSIDGLSPTPPPPPGLAEALPIGSNAVRGCASVRGLLTRRGVRFGNRVVAWARHLRRGYYRARVVTISLPAVSADGAHAVLVAGNGRGGLDGGETWVHMERGRDGRWRATGATALWVA